MDSHSYLTLMKRSQGDGLRAYENDETSNIGRVSKDLKWQHAATIDPNRDRSLTAAENEAAQALRATGTEDEE